MDPTALLALPLLDPSVEFWAYLAAGLVVAVLLVRRRPVRLLWWIGAGALVGGVLLVLVQWVWDLFGGPLSAGSQTWVIGAFAALGVAAAAVLRAPWWRRIIAVLAVPLVLIAAGVGINADYGLAETVGEVLGETTLPAIALPALVDGGDDSELASTWTPPSEMPAKGEVGRISIPATASGFAARPASIYLPPAALVADPPKLPFVLLMMGQPGTTDPTVIRNALDAYAKTHHGLAPIAVVADQLSRSDVDPACVDSAAFGSARTYITQDVVAWARASLNVTSDPAQWTIAGFSNGGTCAALFGAQLPTVFGNVIDVAGEAYPGQEHADDVLSGVFDGDAAAYAAVHPKAVLAAGTYPDSWGFFADDPDDAPYSDETRTVERAAAAAGWHTQWFPVPVPGHGGAMLQTALDAAFTALGPRLGLEVAP
ncbi:esterase [Microbacteriaceae bacterium VKM Ac-2855]|nr:esterase [Microbacteriaceae bacterium VKM Ac-2855]